MSLIVPYSKRSVSYTASNGQTVFPVAWPVLAAGDVTVTRISGGVRTVLTLTTQYMVSGTGQQSGAEINLAAGALAGEVYLIEGSLSPQRSTQFMGNRSIPSDGFNTDLDALTIMVQELRRDVDRAIKRSGEDTSLGTNLVPDAAIDSVIGLDADGDVIAIPTSSLGGGSGAPVSSFMAPVLLSASGQVARQGLGLESAYSDLGVSVGNKFWGLIPNDSSSPTKTANTVSIQAAIDWAYNNGSQTINISAGAFYFNPGIYLDAPGNLRSSLSTPTIFSFSLHLQGAGGLSNHNTSGTQLHFTDNTQVALIVGTGQGMRLSGFSIIGPAGATSRAALPTGGIAIGLAGGSAGLSRALLDGVGVENFRKGYCTGFNSDSLCDSVTLFKCTAFQCYVGAHFSRTQNYINNMIACDFGGNTTHVLSDVAKAVNIIGGNYSTSDTWHNALAITAVSNLTYFLDSTQMGYATDNATFTAHITAPTQAMIDGAYDVFCINTTAFGPVPLLLTNYNAGTQVATFKFYQGWLLSSGMQTNLLGGGGALATLFNTVLGAATTLYACERTTVFDGFCFNVEGVHIENPNAVTRLFNFNSGFGGDFASKFNRLTFNWTIPQTGQGAEVFNCQQCFPFIEMLSQSKGTLELSNIVNTIQSDRVLIDVQEASSTLYKRLIVRNCDIRPNLRAAARPIGGSDQETTTTAGGFGEWDANPFVSATDTLYSQPNMFGAVPFKGYWPAPWAGPHIDPTTLSNIQAGPPGLGTYPPLMGRVPYRVNYPDPYLAVPGVNNAARWIESNHQFFSWGQNLTVNWSYVAGTNVVFVDDFRYLFAGLRIILNNGGGNEFYNISGVFPTLGFITVVRWRPATGLSDLAGTAGTTYTGNTFIQEAYSFSYTGFLPAAKASSNTTAGATTAAAGDLTGASFVNLKLTAVGAANYTTRSATQMFGDIPGAYVGMSYMLAIENTNAGTTTLNAGGGVTITGTATIAQNTTRLFVVTFTSATTCTIVSLGVLATV